MIRLILVLLLLFVGLILPYALYRKVFFNVCSQSELPREPRFAGYTRYRESIRAASGELLKIPCEDVSITSFDKLRLSGRYYHQADGAPVLILFHGYRSSGRRDFAPLFPFYRSLGFNLLLADQRACGRSEGHVVTFGVLERRDCADWAAYAAKRFPESRILLGGVSMGAATVLMASDLPMPEQVKGILADCPYSTPKDIILQVLRQKSPLAVVLWPSVVLGARVFGHFDLCGASAAESLGKSSLPVLLLHGEEDTFVPCRMSRELAEKHPGTVELHTFPGGEHCFCCLTDPAAYEGYVRAFVQRVPG